MEFSILVYVLMIIAFAKGLGEVLSRVNQPAIVGELLAGIVLGPFILGKIFTGLGNMYDDQFIKNLGDLGMLFLMLYVGLEFSPKLIRSASWLGGAIAAAGIGVPFVVGLFAGVYFDLAGPTLVFVAIAMSVTALPVTIRVLKDMEVLKTRTSATIVSAALITDVVLLFAFGVVLGANEQSSDFETVAYLSVSFAIFFALALIVGRYLVPHVYRVLRWMRTGEAAFAIAVGIAIGFAIVAEWAGLPGVIGAFVAGLLLRETGTRLKVWTRVEDILSGVTMGFLAPIFFVVIGFTVDFGSVVDYLPFFASILGIAIVGKIAGSYFAARIGGLGRNESMAIGSMLMGKGAMELVFAQLAFEQGLIEQYMFSLLVLTAFLSTILAPMLFKIYYNRAVKAQEIPVGVKEHDVLTESISSR
ncbi:MAG: cation:proton antiporter [Thermoplasmatota archaeon]|nr:cation:proton antiporter [Candidatus Thermoplasmatota archaeon]